MRERKNLNTELKCLLKCEEDILELKNAEFEIENSQDKITSRLDRRQILGPARTGQRQ